MPREKNPTSPSPGKAAPRKTVTRKKPAAGIAGFVDPGQRTALISKAAYFRAQRRGFAPGHEMEDWLAAEAEVDSQLLRGAPLSGNPLT
jgi:hypothetical protein